VLKVSHNTSFLRPFPPCQICGFDRFTEGAHIIPASLGGPKTCENMLNLCPNHHKLFDRYLLTRQEMQKVWAWVKPMLKFADHLAFKWRDKIIRLYSIHPDDDDLWDLVREGRANWLGQFYKVRFLICKKCDSEFKAPMNPKDSPEKCPACIRQSREIRTAQRKLMRQLREHRDNGPQNLPSV
jgi:hypothetical protein